MQSPLTGIRVLDFSALGPGPFASRLLADYGADVVTVESPETDFVDAERLFGRAKRSLVLNLKAPGARELVLQMIGHFDVLIESMRPGKMETLGLGPDTVATRAPRVIYARLTAFGQHGPLSSKAGHDINAIAIGGALSLCGIGQPLPPAALLGDFAGGSMMLVVGVLLAIIERQRSGVGRVVDAAMSDGAALLVGGMLPLHNRGLWGPQGTNHLDGSAPYYTTYRCADGKWIAVGAIEPKFFAALITALNLKNLIDPADQLEKMQQTRIRELLSKTFMSRSRDEWEEIFRGVDACVSPVLDMNDLATHPHHIARGSVYQASDGVQAGVAPRLSDCDRQPGGPSPAKGADSESVLRECGFSARAITDAIASGAVIAAAASKNN
jgi:alpha-methylacyl-CoA racemase